MNPGSTSALAPRAAKPIGTVRDYLTLARFGYSTNYIVFSGTMSFIAYSSGEDCFRC